MPGTGTQYVKSGEVSIAYQVVGDGPFDLLWVPGWVSNVEASWEVPEYARFLDRLASFSRLILFDKRGTGMSDRVSNDRLPTLEERMDDVRAVLDAARSPEAAVFGASEGGNLSALFAATYPDRVRALVLASVYAKRVWAPDYPWAPTPEQRAESYEQIDREWSGDMDLSVIAPATVADEALRRRLATFFRRSASPGAAVALLRMNTAIDTRAVLPTIAVPTLVLQRRGDRDVNVEEGRFIAGQIRGARYVELPGDDHLVWVGDSEELLDEVEAFLTGVRPGPAVERFLTTILFTDIVGSTERAAAGGDRRWRELLGRHHAIVRRELERFGGREIDSAGDGFLASFDGPARAIRCAYVLSGELRSLGIEIRAGVHTGEVERLGDKLAGIAVHTGARIMAQATAGEALVSSTVRDLVAGSGIEFADRGQHRLKGIPDAWRLYGVLRA